MTSEHHANLILTNANILTMAAELPRAQFVAIRESKIVGVGPMEQAGQFKGPSSREMDCQGMTLLPGFYDAHLHILALAGSLTGVDCRPSGVRSIPQLIEAIRLRARETPSGEWIRAYGYDEFYLAEKRHPTREELDIATADHPVRLDHRTGHASVLNSRALISMGISKSTPDPVDGIIQRDETTGEPTGILLEMGQYLRNGSKAEDNQGRFLDGVKRADRLLLSRGITSVVDAGPGNDLGRYKTLHNLKRGGKLESRVTMMVGIEHLASFIDEGITPGDGDNNFQVGAVKLMLTATTGTLQPSPGEMKQHVVQIHKMGFQVAIHAVEADAVEAASEAIARTRSSDPAPRHRHRIEHCSECPPKILAKLKSSGAIVTTQPGFIYHNGDQYISKVEEDLRPYLYPVKSFMGAGIIVAAGSDAPVIRPDPLTGIYSAVTRCTEIGAHVARGQGISVEEALRMHTINGAYASFQEKERGSISVGKLADMVLLDQDPTKVGHESTKNVDVVMTMIGGEVVWER